MTREVPGRTLSVADRFRHQIPALFDAIFVVERRFIDRSGKCYARVVPFGQHNGVVFLAAMPAEEGGVEPCLGVFRAKDLSVEGHPALAWLPQRRIQAPRAREELVQLE